MATVKYLEIHRLISNRCFNEARLLFEKSDLIGSDLVSIYKKQNKEHPRLFDQPEFWESELPLLRLDEVMKSEIKSSFLHKYFSKNEHANDRLTIELFSNFENDFLRYYRFNQAFLFPAFRESLKQISIDVPEATLSYLESQLICEEFQLLESKQTEIESQLENQSLDEILIGLTLLYAHEKKSPEMRGNKAWQYQIENLLIEFIDRVLFVKKGSSLTKMFSSNETVQKEFDRYRPDSNHPLTLPLAQSYKKISSLVKNYLDITSRKNKLELYQCEYADLKSRTIFPPILEPNEEYSRFRKNDYKKGVEELYFLDHTLENLFDRQPFKRDSIETDLKVFEFYGIPKNLGLSLKRVDLEKVLLLLKHFSTFKGPPERTGSESKPLFVHNKADEAFRELFGTNESITLFEYNQLNKGISDYFNWPEIEVDFLLNFLTYDINEGDPPHLWIQRPFLKVNHQIIWLGTFLKDRRWNNILLNRIRKEYSNTIGSQIATNLEKRVEAVFQEAGYKTTQGLKYPRKGPPKGDVDVAAYKNNYLFICEVKSGERSHDFSYAAQREMVKLGEEASDQVNRALKNANTYWTMLQERLGVEIDRDTVTIVPMIITDTFEGDDYFNGSEIRKISLLELDVILKNKKRELLEIYQMTEMMTNRRPFQPKEDSDWDLWGGKDVLSCERFLEIIDKNEVWDGFI